MFTATAARAGKINAVQVHYSYKEPGSPDHVADTAMIRPADLETGTVVSRRTFRQIDAPVRFRPVFLRDGAPSIELPEQQTWVQAGRESVVEIPQPWSDFLQISARVMAIDGLKRVQVDLQHRDGTFQSDGVISLDAEGANDAGTAWTGRTTLPQVNGANQRFRYRYSVEGPGQLAVSPWIELEGDQEIIPPVLAVKLRTDRLKLGEDYSEALLGMVYSDPSRGVETRHEFFLTKENAHGVWLVPRVDPNAETYKYTLTLFKPSGEPVELGEREGRGTNLLLVPPAVV